MNLQIENTRFILMGAILLSLFITGSYFRNSKQNPDFARLGSKIYLLAMLNGVILVTIDYYINQFGVESFRNWLVGLLLLDANLLFYEASKFKRRKRNIIRGKNGKENL